jgi:hypothetical protein
LAAVESFPHFLIAFLNSPCYETPKDVKKHRAKQPGEKKTEEKKPHFL